MAYISAFDDDEEGKPAALTGVAPLAAGSAPGPVAQQQPQQSRFVNFSRFLDANRGAAQATADKISGDINKQGQQVSSDLSNAQQQFGQAVQNGSNAATGYTGPKALSDNAQWQQMQDNARKTQDAAAATASSGGIGALLQEQNRGAYSGGNRRLDSALTGHVGADDFAKARERYGKMSDALNSANAASVQTADAARSATDAAKGQYDAEQAANAEREAAAKQAADDAKLLNEVEALIAQETKPWSGADQAQTRADYVKYHTPRWREMFDRKYGAGTWDRYVAAKQKAADARGGAIKATYTGGY